MTLSPETPQSPEGTPVEPLTLRRVMGHFPTGVAVVTTEMDEEPHGMTVNSLTSVSLDPPMVLVSLTTGARTTDAVSRAGRFAVSILSVRQEEIALRFARRSEDHFGGLALEYGAHSVPVVPSAVAHVECAVEQEIAAGDHVIFLGRVLATCDREGQPLGFHAGRFGEFSHRGHDVAPWFF